MPVTVGEALVCRKCHETRAWMKDPLSVQLAPCRHCGSADEEVYILSRVVQDPVVKKPGQRQKWTVPRIQKEKGSMSPKEVMDAFGDLSTAYKLAESDGDEGSMEILRAELAVLQGRVPSADRISKDMALPTVNLDTPDMKALARRRRKVLKKKKERSAENRRNYKKAKRKGQQEVKMAAGAVKGEFPTPEAPKPDPELQEAAEVAQEAVSG